MDRQWEEGFAPRGAGKEEAMEFQQFYLTCLAHASYLIGSAGVAAMVDPQRDVELYLEEAARRGLCIQHIIETHLHIGLGG